MLTQPHWLPILISANTTFTKNSLPSAMHWPWGTA
jgi:hypothetical protein